MKIYYKSTKIKLKNNCAGLLYYVTCIYCRQVIYILCKRAFFKQACKKNVYMNLTDYKISYISCTKHKGQKPELVNEATLIAGKGLLGDYHSLGDDGLIVIVSEDLLNFIDQSITKGLCFKRFNYNICLSESIANFSSGQNLNLNDVTLQISEKNKRCFAQEQDCKLASGTCKLLTEVKFAKILNGGTINVHQNVNNITG